MGDDMRLSYDEDDPGYVDPNSAGGRLINGTRVYLDGEEVQHVLTADDVEGYVESLMMDDSGSLVLRHGAALVQKRKGQVRIDLPDGVTLERLRLVSMGEQRGPQAS